MPAKRVCPIAGCPTLIPAGTRYCPTHTREYDTRRGTATARGYGTTHRAERARWQRRIDAGEDVTCWRCGQPIQRDDDWDLGHDDHDRSITRGPEHSNRCNRAAAGRRGRAMQTGRDISPDA